MKYLRVILGGLSLSVLVLICAGVIVSLMSFAAPELVGYERGPGGYIYDPEDLNEYREREYDGKYHIYDEPDTTTSELLIDARMLAMNANELDNESSLNQDYHKIYLVDDMVIGKLGSMSYIIGKNGERLTSGHHTLWCEWESIYGKLGATEELIGYL